MTESELRQIEERASNELEEQYLCTGSLEQVMCLHVSALCQEIRRLREVLKSVASERLFLSQSPGEMAAVMYKINKIATEALK